MAIYQDTEDFKRWLVRLLAVFATSEEVEEINSVGAVSP